MRPVVLLLLLSACGGASADSHREEESAAAAARPASGGLVTADTTTVEVPLALPAQLYVEHDAAVYARSAGIIEAILADLGTRVKAGQLLARLESTDQAIALSQARERHANTKVQVERQRALKTAGVVTQADSERVELEFREAELALQKAQREFDLTRVVAPFEGVVTGRAARIGRLVASGDSLFRVTALAPVLAAVRVPETPAFGIRIGAEAEVAGPRGESARARVVRASPVIDAGSGTREVVLQLVGGVRLPPGSSVTVRLGAESRRVVAIPREAVGDGYALVWDADRTTLRQVTVGSPLPGDRIEIVSGLQPGEQVVRAGP